MTFSVSLRRWIAWVGMVLGAGIPVSAAPVITSFTPDVGPPGTQVQIFGSGLRPTAVAPIVQFGNVTANLVSANNNRIVAIAPDKVPIGPITVYITQGQGQGQYTTPFYFYSGPRIEDFGTKYIAGTDFFEKPVIGTPGSTLTIQGGNFFVPGFPNILAFIGSNGISARATAENQILGTIPAVIETGYLSVFTAVGGVTNTTDYIYGAPRITAFTTNGAAGDSIQIQGLNFLVKNPNQLQVTIGNAVATQVEVQSNTNMAVVVPVSAVTGRVAVTVPGGSFITTSNFTVLPKVTVFAPNKGGPGTVVTLVGSGLTGTTQVLFGSVAAATATITNLSSAQVTAVVPSGVNTGPITLITGAGTNVTEQLFYGPPQISGFNPASGQPGTSVTLTGANFLGATSVTLNGLGIPTFNVLNNSQILLAIPANATSGRFTVIGPGGTNESQSTFTVQGREPLITAFSPKYGPAGTKVTVVGNNLGTATRVTFNGVQANFTVKSAASIETTVPNGATTGKIRVTNPDGAADTVEDFIVGSNADLRLTFGATPNPAVAFGTVIFNLLVVNNGPIPASDTRIQVELPPGLAFLEAVSSYPYETSGQTVTFLRGAIEPQGFFTGQVKANAGSINENRVVTARVLTPTPDPVPGDNERSINLVVALPVLSVELLTPTELLLSWPAAAGGLYSPKTAPTLSSPWVPAPGTPENDGSRIQLTVPATDAVRLFRLELN